MPSKAKTQAQSAKKVVRKLSKSPKRKLSVKKSSPKRKLSVKKSSPKRKLSVKKSSPKRKLSVKKSSPKRKLSVKSPKRKVIVKQDFLFPIVRPKINIEEVDFTHKPLNVQTLQPLREVYPTPKEVEIIKPLREVYPTPKEVDLFAVWKDNCNSDEYYGPDGNCAKYLSRGKFHTDECTDNDLEVDWRSMKCASGPLNPEENDHFKNKFKAWANPPTKNERLKRRAEICRSRGEVYDAKQDDCVAKAVKGQADWEGGSLLELPVSQKEPTCGPDEFNFENGCKKYATSSFDADDCEDEDLVADWKYMRCAKTASPNNKAYKAKFQKWAKSTSAADRASVLKTKAKDCAAKQERYDAKLDKCVPRTKGEATLYSGDFLGGRDYALPTPQAPTAPAMMPIAPSMPSTKGLLNQIKEGRQLRKATTQPSSKGENQLLKDIRAGKQLKGLNKEQEAALEKLIADCEKDQTKMYSRKRGCIDRPLTKEQLEGQELTNRVTSMLSQRKFSDVPTSTTTDDWDTD